MDLKEASRRIFGNLPTGQQRNGNKILKRKLQGPLMGAYLQKPFQHVAQGIVNSWLGEEEQRRKEKLAWLRRRGKGPPKKGEGKRSSKRK